MKTIALLVADIHLSLNPPAARAAEPDWLTAQGRILEQLEDLKDKYQCPVVYAGDLFDRWSSGPELVNWAIRKVPKGFSVPGQHDLPLHRYEDVKKSSYWTLVESGVLCDLAYECPKEDDRARLGLWGFPFGKDVFPLPDDVGDPVVHIAVVHAYVWKEGKGYGGSPKESLVSRFKPKLEGYSVGVFGDNHQRFMSVWPGGCLYNCGCLIPRKVDEREQTPAVGLLQEDGRVLVHKLDTSADKWTDVEEVTRAANDNVGLEEAMRELGSLEATVLDYGAEIRRHLDNPDNKVGGGARRVLLEVLEGKK